MLKFKHSTAMSKSKTISPFYMPVALFMLLLMTIPSCIYDYFPEDEETGIIVVSLAGVQTRAAGDPLFTNDEEITKVRIFVFAGDLLEKNELFTSGSEDFTNPFIIDVVTGPKDVYVVANESATLATTLAAVTTKTGLKAVLADEIDSPLTLPLLMMGNATASVIAVENPDRNNVTITLTRVAAKISLKFKKDTSAEVKITKVSLLNNTGKTPIWEGAATITGQSYWKHEVDLSSSPLALTTTSAALDPVYVYENITDGNKTNAVQLEVEALYNNIPATYRVYINENVSSSGDAGDPALSVTNPFDHLYSIRRNHEYRLTGTIKNIGESDGLTLTTNVLPWNYLPSTVLFDYDYTIAPHPTYGTRTYTVDASGKVSFTFKLNDPVNASWAANLTNPTDFEFDGAFQGVTGNEVTVTIKTRNAPGDGARETEFYINAGYGGNWTEIPLLSDSDLVGEGNRIVIRQPANP